MPHRLGARIALAGLSVALTAGGIRSATQAPRPPIEQRLPAHLFEIVDRHRTRAVRADHAVDTADRDLSGAHRMPAMRRQNLLADGLRRHAWLVASVDRSTLTCSPSPLERRSTGIASRISHTPSRLTALIRTIHNRSSKFEVLSSKFRPRFPRQVTAPGSAPAP